MKNGFVVLVLLSCVAMGESRAHARELYSVPITEFKVTSVPTSKPSGYSSLWGNPVTLVVQANLGLFKTSDSKVIEPFSAKSVYGQPNHFGLFNLSVRESILVGQFILDEATLHVLGTVANDGTVTFKKSYKPSVFRVTHDASWLSEILGIDQDSEKLIVTINGLIPTFKR